MKWVRAVAAVGLVSTGVVLVGVGPSQAQLTSCAGGAVIEEAPYACSETRVIDGFTVTASLNVDAAGRAVIDFSTPTPPQADVPVAVHNYTSLDAEPRLFIDGTILAGQTTVQLVIPLILCGQIDMKAVEVTPGSPAGLIAGPQVTWGQVCQQVPTTVAPTTVAPTTVAPTTTPVSPTSIRPTSAPGTTLPSTGGSGSIPWTWGLAAVALGLGLSVLPRFWGPHRADG